MSTEILNLVEIQQGQNQKEVTHNEALRQLEAKLVRVLSRTTTAEPGSPGEGDTYIVPTGATGTDWSNKDGDVAHFFAGSWKFYTPEEGWRFWVNDEDIVVAYDGTQFVTSSSVPKYIIANKSADYTIQNTENGFLFLVDASGSNITITLPAAGSLGGVNVGVVKVDSSANTVTVVPDSGVPDTIEGAASLILEDQWQGTLLASDDVDNWLGIGGGSGGADLPLLDDEAKIFANASDNTKAVSLDLSGITTATTRTYAAPNKDGTLALLSDATGGGIASNEFDEDGGTTSGLTWGFQAGNFREGNTVTQIAAGTVSLVDNSTNYVFINTTNQTVEVNQSGHPINSIPIRELVTVSGVIDTNTDVRAWNVVSGGDVTGPASSVDNALARFDGLSGKTVQDSKVTVDDDGVIDGYAQKIVSRTTDFTLAANDTGRTHEVATGAAATITVPANSSVLLPVGFTLAIVQADSNAVTISPATGVTVNSKDGLTSTNGQWGGVTLYKRATDEWVLIGDLV